MSWIDPLKVLARFPLDAGKLVINGTKITMEAPKLSGYTREQRWYEMNAKAAAQDVTKPDLVELSEVRAKIETADKNTILSVVEGRLVQSQDQHPQSQQQHHHHLDKRLRDAS